MRSESARTHQKKAGRIDGSAPFQPVPRRATGHLLPDQGANKIPGQATQATIHAPPWKTATRWTTATKKWPCSGAPAAIIPAC